MLDLDCFELELFVFELLVLVEFLVFELVVLAELWDVEVLSLIHISEPTRPY